MFNVYRSPNHPTHSYILIGRAASVEAAKALLPAVVCIDEDGDNPDHFDAFAASGTLYTIIPEGSRYTPARVLEDA